jgi:hypothetical protein
MYFAFKKAKKKYNERKQAKAVDISVLNAGLPLSDVQPAVPHDPIPSDHNEISAPLRDNTVLTDEEKAQSLVVEKNDTPQEDPLEKKRRRKYRLKIIFGLAAPFALISLDTTIIASALPFIAEDFSKEIHNNARLSETNLPT